VKKIIGILARSSSEYPDSVGRVVQVVGVVPDVGDLNGNQVTLYGFGQHAVFQVVMEGGWE